MTKTFFRQVLPAMLAFAFSGLYTIVDGFFVGRNVGDVGLAAINIAYPLVALTMAVGTGIGMGGAVQIAVSRGRRDPEERRYLGNTLTLLTLAGLLLTAALLLVSRPALELLGAQGEVLDAGLIYLRSILVGTLFQLGATGLAPLLRNYDGALPAMGSMIAGFVTNIVLDWLFVSVFQWGLAGAAWATVTGQIVTAVPCAYFLFRRAGNPGGRSFRLNRSLLGPVCKTALSPFGLSLSPFLIIILMNKAAVLHGGETAVAAYAVVSYVVAIIQLLLQGIGDGSQPLMSLYLGRGEAHHARHVRNLAYGFSAVMAAVCAAAVLLLREPIPSFFGASEQAAPLVVHSLPIFASGFLFIAFTRVTTSYFYATRQNALSYVLVYGEPALLALFLWGVFPVVWGLDGVWASVPINQALLFLAALALLWTAGRRRKKRTPATAPQDSEGDSLSQEEASL